MLLDDVRAELTKAIKNGPPARKNILRLVISEAGQANAVDDDEIMKIMRKMIERNKETMTFVKDTEGEEARVHALEAEISVLESFLPRMLSSHEVRSSLMMIRDQLRTCPKEGLAIGMAMKYLKGKGDVASVDGRDVREVVLDLRGDSDK